MPETDDKISALYEKSKSQLEPPGHLDAEIRDAARKAEKHHHRRIYSAFGLAATLVLGVGVTWMYIRIAPDSAVPETFEESAISTPAPASAIAPQPAQVLRAPTLNVAPAPETEVRSSASPIQAESATRKMMSSGLAFDSAAESTLAEPLVDCDSEMQDESREAWVQSIENARAANNDDLSQCLEREFIKLFGHAPEKSEPSQGR